MHANPHTRVIALTGSHPLSPSLEDYLEVIFHLVRENSVARATSIARRMRVSKSSVTGALKHLSAKGMIHYDPYSFVTLTPQGEVHAQRIVGRHSILSEFLRDALGVPAKTAELNACRMEHAVDDQVLTRLLRFTDPSRADTPAHQGDKSAPEPASAPATLDNGMQNGVTLDTLHPGQKGRVLKVGSAGEISRRIVDMGLARGTVVEVERVAPLGDPVEFKLKGFHLSLRKEEARRIWVELL